MGFRGREKIKRERGGTHKYFHQGKTERVGARSGNILRASGPPQALPSEVLSDSRFPQEPTYISFAKLIDYSPLESQPLDR